MGVKDKDSEPSGSLPQTVKKVPQRKKWILKNQYAVYFCALKFTALKSNVTAKAVYT